jgi:hypothetical protein
MNRRWRSRAALLAVIAAATSGSAHAEGLSLTLEPGFAHTETDVTDQSGATRRETLDLLTQSYRLAFDRSITERLTASAGGTFVDQRGWQEADGVSSLETSRATMAFARLTLGLPALTAGVGVDSHVQSSLASASRSFVTENYSGFLTWRPIDLPEVDFRIGRVNMYDASRQVQDVTTDSAILGVRYGEARQDLRYLLAWSHIADAKGSTDTTSLDQSVRGTRNDTLFEGRTISYVSGTFLNRNTLTSTQATGGTVGTVARQQVPVNGLSAVESFPATAVDGALAPNSLLVDGNTTTSAGLSLDVGFGPSLVGDHDARAMGAAFADEVTPVNTIYVWFDKSITAVGTALTSAVAVYQSRDNQTWTAVPITAPPHVSDFENRVEITFTQVQARYLKVTMRPLVTGVTTDAAYRDIFVTEAQFLLVLSADLVPHRQSAYALSANVTARTTLLRSPELAHDLAGSVARESASARTTYSIVNGLSIAHPLTRTLAANARAARQDLDAGRGHEGVWQWTAAVTGKPYTTAYWTLNYSGNTNDLDKTVAHSITALGRADWYEGISTQATGTATFLNQAERMVNGITVSERKGSSGQASATASFTPNRLVTVTLGALVSRTVTYTPETGDVVAEFARADGSLSLTFTPALYGSGTISRVFLGEHPTTLATMQVNYSPLRGDLQLGAGYSKSFDTASAATVEYYGPSLRWNVRRGVSLTSAYTVLNSVAPAQILRSRSFTVNLLILL